MLHISAATMQKSSNPRCGCVTSRVALELASAIGGKTIACATPEFIVVFDVSVLCAKANDVWRHHKDVCGEGLNGEVVSRRDDVL